MIVVAVAVEEPVGSISLTVCSRHHHCPGWPRAVARVTGDSHEHAQVSDATRCHATPDCPDFKSACQGGNALPTWRTDGEKPRQADELADRRAVARCCSETRPAAASLHPTVQTIRSLPRYLHSSTYCREMWEVVLWGGPAPPCVPCKGKLQVQR